MKSNIALIGFMGAGKSAVGRALASAAGMDFLDLDKMVEEQAGRSISNIFSLDGEPSFRRMETEIIKDAAVRINTVIACGGGVVLDQVNIEAIRHNAVIIYLTAEPSILLGRVLNSRETRPLLQVFDPASAMKDLLKHREPLYRAAADLTVNTSALDIEGVVQNILAEIRKNESRSFTEQA
jgi:shikimate kinase